MKDIGKIQLNSNNVECNQLNSLKTLQEIKMTSANWNWSKEFWKKWMTCWIHFCQLSRYFWTLFFEQMCRCFFLWTLTASTAASHFFPTTFFLFLTHLCSIQHSTSTIIFTFSLNSRASKSNFIKQTNRRRSR